MSGIDTLGRLQLDTTTLRMQLQTLTRQTSTGKVAGAIGDLAPQLPRIQGLAAEVSRRGTYGTVIGQALGRADATQSALTRLSDIATQFSDTVAMKLDPNNPEAVTFAANQAKSALVQVGQLLNSQYNGEYLFGGSDFGNPPVPDPTNLPSSGMATQIATAVAGLASGNAASVAAATKAAAEDNATGVTPFSAFLSDPATGLAEPQRSVPSGDGQTIGYGVFANRNAAATSSGETTGSWARDLLRGLASIAALGPAQTSQPADFNSLATIIRDGLKAARNGLADEAGALGLTQTQLTTVQTQHTVLSDSLKAQLANITDVDMAATFTKLQQTQTTLQASYTALSRLGALTLSSFLK